MNFSYQPNILSFCFFSRVFLVAIIYSIFILPTKFLLMLMPGAEVRFAACIPVVAGMLWGPAGAVGSALGNFCGDFFSGDSLYICFWGAVANFFLAYLPYKLWYTGRNQEKSLLFIYNTGSLLKFMGIMLITAFVFAAMLTAIVMPTNANTAISSFFIFFSNNFDFPLLLGIPILLLLRRCNVNITIPGYNKGNTIVSYGALIIAIILAVCFLGVAFTETKLPFYDLDLYLLLIIFCLSLTCRYLPIDIKDYAVNSKSFCSLATRATTGFLLLAIVSIVFIVVMVFITNPALIDISQKLELWRAIFMALLFSINIIFVAMLIILRQTEKNVIYPLNTLSKMADEFVSGNYADDMIVSQINYKNASVDEIENLCSSFAKMNTDIKNYIKNLKIAVAKNESVATQLNIAADIQQGMLADVNKINDRLKDYSVFAGMYPAREVGGDLYDCFLLDEEHLAVIIADVSGKGIPAALFMTVTKALLQNNCSASPALTLERTNETLCKNNNSMMFVTVWLGIVDLQSGKITYANAGHNYPLIKTNDTVEWLEGRSGPALGIKNKLKFKEYTAQLSLDSKLLLYTDGITEAENIKHQFYGKEKLLKRFQQADNLENILFSVLEFSEGMAQSDDITVLWLQRK